MIEGVMLKQATKAGAVFLKVGGWRIFPSLHQRHAEAEYKGMGEYPQHSWPAVRKYANWRRMK